MPGNAEQPVNGIHWNLTNPSTGQSHKYHYAGVTAQTAFPHYSSLHVFFALDMYPSWRRTALSLVSAFAI